MNKDQRDNAFRDFHDFKSVSVVDFAYQIIDMHNSNERLKDELAELREYRQKYFDLLNSSTAHSQAMVGSILKIAMTPGVLDAISTSNKKES
jgi:hypothetical protein